MAKKIKVEDIVSYIDNEISAAHSFNTKVVADRQKALKSYNMEPYGNEKRGRSTYVASDVQETISWALPQIMKVFSKRDFCKFDATKPDQKNSAELATLYATDVLFKQNPGFLILHNFFHDALLQKNGFLKVAYDKSDSYELEEYENLTDTELAMLLQDETVEPIEHAEQDVFDPLGNLVYKKHDLKIKRRIKSVGGNIKIENVPVEEVVVSKNTRSLNLDDSPFISHRVKRSISWLREQGYKIKDDINDGTEISTDYSLEKMEREAQDGSYYTQQQSNPVDPSMRLVWVSESYLKVDFNGDGIAELRKITKVGSTVLDNEEVYTQPFISTSPLPQPHKFNGQSLADLVGQLQLLKTMTTRAMLDSFAFNINPSKAVDITKVVDVNDLLDTNPGNFIRMRGDVGPGIIPLPSTGVGSEALQLLSYIDNIVESRTGISKQTQGIDANEFNQTATAAQIQMNASQEKLAMIVRIFAETGMAPLYKKIIQLASNFSDGPELVELNSQFVEVNPMNWKHMKSISITVGTGALDKQAELSNLNSLLSIQQQLLASQKPELISLIDPMKVYNSVDSVVKSMGYNNSSEFFNRPGGQEYSMVMQYIQQQMAAQQPPPPVDPNASIAEAEKIKSAQELMIKTANFELDKLKADREFELKKYETQLKYETELLKLKQINDTSAIEAQLAEINSLNPSNELLSQSEINTITQVITNQGGDPTNIGLYASILQERDAKKAAAEEERNMQKNMNHELLLTLKSLSDTVNTPKQIIRDKDGRIVGVVPTNGDL